MSLYAKGAVPDTPHRKMGYRFSNWAHPRAPGLTSLAHHECAPFDQGPTSSCEGHRAAMALTVAYNAMGLSLEIPSPDGIYRDARCMARRPVNHVLPPLDDAGCMTADVFLALSACGVRAIGEDVDGRHSDVGADVNREPRLDELATERRRIVTGEVALTIDADIAGKVLYHLSNNRPVGFDVWVDTTFERWGRAWDPALAPLNAVDLTDKEGGWHAILCTEIEVSTDGTVTFGGPNSWGSGWGAPPLGDHPITTRGHWRATVDWIRRAVDGAQIWGVK